MIEIKLESLRLMDDYNYNKIDLLSFSYIYNGFDTHIFVNPYGEATLNEYDFTYGIKYKYLQGYNSNNQYTQAYITDWDNDWIYSYNWSNSRPAIGSTIKLVISSPKIYIIPNPVATINVEDLLVEDSLTLLQQYESTKKMDLRVSRSSFNLINSIELQSFMDKYWTADKYQDIVFVEPMYHIIGVHIIIDGIGKFWGYAKPENISYDPEGNIWMIDAYDWVKFVFETQAQNQLPDYPSSGHILLSNFLQDNMPMFNGLNIDIGSFSQSWEAEDYNRINEDGVLVSVENLMTVQDMLIEAIKYYCAFMYYDGNKTLIFKNRGKAGSIKDINNKVISGQITKTYRPRDYDSLLLSVKGEWDYSGGVWSQWEGWSLVWLEDGEIQALTVNGDLSNIPTGRKYLDLRQNVPYTTFDFRLFQTVSRDDVLEQFKDLLNNVDSYETELVGIDYELHNSCFFENKWYLIKSLEINYGSGTTKVILEKING